jgi:hypothetical protein
MNELIKELEKQCWSHRVDGTLVDGQLHFDTKKFAELIVKECVQVLDTCHVDIAKDADLEDNNTWVNATMNTTVNFCMGRVKQHFGVEE